jgi:putative CocE/NonD family hydrolase
MIRRPRPRVVLAAVFLTLIPLAVNQSLAAAPDEPDQTYPGQVAQSSLITTRYGDHLKIDLCYPADASGNRITGKQFPVIVEMSYTTSADWNAQCSGQFLTYVQHGYVAGFVNTPGTGGSEGGPFNPFDAAWQARAYDAVEWLGTQPWSTGKVGTIGCSGNGLTQWYTAKSHPPHLATMIPYCAPEDAWTLVMPGGMPSLEIISAGCGIPGVLTDARQGAWVPTDQQQAEYMVEMNKQKAYYGQVMPFCPLTDSWVAHPTRDAYWSERMNAHEEDITIPVWVWGNFNDLLWASSTEQYLGLGSKKKMFAAGWTNHAAPGPGFDATAESLRWFDRFLKGKRNGIDKELDSTRFRYLLNRKFQWKTAEDFPIPGTQYTDYNFTGEATNPLANGGLATSPPSSDTEVQYVYSPSEGFQTGMYSDFIRARTVNDPSNDDVVAHNDPTGPTDQRLAAGPHAATFVSPPASSGTELTGPVTATLYAKTTATDTDFVVKLVDVFPDGTYSGTGPQPGYWSLVTQGNLKGTFRTFKDNYLKQTPIPANEVVKYEVQLRATGYWLEKGHSLGVIVTSADFPRETLNQNPAVVTVVSSPQYPSHVTLPVIPAS